MGQKVRCKKCRKNTKDRCKKCKYGQKFVVYFGGAGYNPVRNHKRGGSVGVQGGKRSIKSKSQLRNSPRTLMLELYTILNLSVSKHRKHIEF